MAEMKRKFQGVWIPSELWLNRDLSLNEKVMIVEIASLQSEDKGCYASNAHFAEFFNLSNSRVSEIINNLDKKGYLNIEYIREGKMILERQIRVCEVFGKSNTPSEKAETPFGKGGEPPSENTEGSNTSFSSTVSNTKRKRVEDFPIPDAVNQQAWQEWIDYRKDVGLPKYKQSSMGVGRVLNDLVSMSEGNKEIQAQIVQQAIAKQWKGLYPIGGRASNKPMSANLNNQKFESGSF